MEVRRKYNKHALSSEIIMPEQINLKKLFEMKKIGVLMGGISSEREISLNSGSSILDALLRKGYNAVAIDIDIDIANTLKQSEIDAAFIALHGIFGEDGSIQGLLEIAKIPYTGSGLLSSAISMNKNISKQIFNYHGLPTPSFQTFISTKKETNLIKKQINISLPFVVKPSEEGSTIGISIVKNKDEVNSALFAALECNSEIIIEKFIKGRELTATVINGKPLPLIEIIPKSGFYDYQSKYTSGATEYIVAPTLDTELEAKIQGLAIKTYHAMYCCGAARVDFILDEENNPSILEINTIPGMTENSLMPKAAKKAGISFDDLVEKILLSATLHKNKNQKRN
jgi:D-alanine-D-alanine ligase